MRVYEFAKKIEISSKELLSELAKAGFKASSHMSMLTDQEVAFLNKKYINKAEKPKKQLFNDEPRKQAEIKKEPEQEKVQQERRKEEKKEVPQPLTEIVLEPMTPAHFAQKIEMPTNEVILTLLKWGIIAPKNQLLDESVIERLAAHYQILLKKPEIIVEEKKEIFISEEAEIKPRPPILVVLGHVDHGKTTLLDLIRNTRVAAKEKGGITQHLGAYHVDTKHGGVIFIDTPGHEAFTKIRARGVKTADIAILVIAADDGIMPQTIEAIRHAKQMEVPIIVAINKIDKVDPSRLEIVKRQLAEHDLLPEEWGGQIIVVPISAKVGTGVDELLEMIDLQAQVMELEADIAGDAKGYVLESKLEKGRGPVATVILQQGHLNIGDYFISGQTVGRVSSITDSYSKQLKEVGPVVPVQVAGFSALPNAGDLFEAVSKEQIRKVKAAEKKPQMLYKEKAINILIKTDTNSSKEALEDALKKLSKKIEHTDYHIIFSGVGDITERDVMLASHTKSAIIGLHVKVDSKVLQLAQQEGVNLSLFDIIYKLLESLEKQADKMKEVKMIDKKIGEAIVRKVFDIKKVGIIAGCYVNEGIFSKNGKVVVLRKDEKIGEGPITSLQREGKTVKDVHTGFEFAFMAEGLEDFAVDDRVECFVSVPEQK